MNASSKDFRLDQLLVKRHLCKSRSRARDMIARGCVTVDGRKVVKSGTLIFEDCHIEINDPAQNYVSRAALKLIAGLDVSGINSQGMHAIDLGASTGGFTQVLLERGVASVLALDVGHGQLVSEISADPRVTDLQGFNARNLKAENLTYPPSLVVSDMSFVSLTIAAEPALLLSNHPAFCVLLVKPQFEVGKEGIGKGGLVVDQSLVENTNVKIQQWFEALPGWKLTHFVPSPLQGGDGNQEFLLCGERHA